MFGKRIKYSSHSHDFPVESREIFAIVTDCTKKKNTIFWDKKKNPVYFISKNLYHLFYLKSLYQFSTAVYVGFKYQPIS